MNANVVIGGDGRTNIFNVTAERVRYSIRSKLCIELTLMVLKASIFVHRAIIFSSRYTIEAVNRHQLLYLFNAL